MSGLKIEVGGKPVSPHQMGDAIEALFVKKITDQLRTRVADIRDPETGEVPVLSVRGRNLATLSVSFSGSEQVLALAAQRLREVGMISHDSDGENVMRDRDPIKPRAFLCHAGENKALGRQIATDLMAKGIETFFDEWCIEDGESLRQKIDEGLVGCTHFIVLLTPESLRKPWVNAEIDAAFVRKLAGLCKFIPLRHGLAPEALPPLLGALLSPELIDYERNMQALINGIYEVSKKPPLGEPPAVVRNRVLEALGVSAAAEAIVRVMMERTEHGDDMDPQIEADDLRSATGLTDDDIIDAVEELEQRGYVRRLRAFGGGSLGFPTLFAEGALFVAFDKHFTDWNPEADALKIAADLVNGVNDGMVPKIAEAYGWAPRRMNPAVNFLIEHGLVESSGKMGTHPWCRFWIRNTHRTRRFVRDHA